MDAESRIRIAISSVLSAKGFDDAAASTEKLKQKAKDASRGLNTINDSLSSIEKNAKSIVQPLYTVQGILSAYGAGTAIKSLIDINAQFESMQTGIAALIAVNAQNETSIGRAITTQEKFNLAQRESANVVELLRKANIETPATLSELTDGFQAAVGPALKLNWSLEQTVKYTTLMTQAAAAMGMPMNQLAQEMRSVLSGQIDMNSQVARNLGITNDQITQHIKLGDTYGFLMRKLQDFEAAGAQMATNWEGVTSNLTDTFNSIKKKAGENLFGAFKTDLAEFNTLLTQNSDQIAGEFSAGLMTAYNSGKTLLGGLYEMRGVIDNVVVGYAAFKVGGMIATGIATATAGITAMNAALKTATATQLAFNIAAKANPYVLGTMAIGVVGYAAYEAMADGNKELEDSYNKNVAYWTSIANENTQSAKTKEGMLKTAESYEQKYQDIFEKTGQRIEAYKTQADQLRKMADSASGSNTGEKLKFGGKTLTDEEAKAQSLAALKAYEDYYKSIEDLSSAWAIKENDIRNKNTVLSETQLQKLLSIEKEAYLSTSKITKDRKKMTEEMSKFEEEQFAILAQTSAKSFRQLDGIIDWEEAEKNATNSIKNMESAYLTYYEAIGDGSKAFYLKEERFIQDLKDLKILTDSQIFEIRAKNEEKFLKEQFEKNNKWLYDFFDNVNKSLDEQLLAGAKGKFKSFGEWLENTLSAIGDSMLAGISRSVAGSITGTLQNAMVNSMRSNYAIGLSALGDGSAVSASEIASIMNAGGAFNSETNSITTAGGTAIKLAQDGSGTVSKGGSDILSLASTVSTLKTAYSVLTGGISSSIMTGFDGVADMFASNGMWSTSTGISNFGYGFANPLSNYSVGSGAFSSTMAGGMLSSGLLGYGMGSLGDMLFGADTKAGIGGAAGAAIGSIIPGVGTIVGGLIGSALGGLFGSKKITDTGLNFLNNATSDNIDVMGYSDWKKKSWFSSSKGSTPTELSATQKREIEGVFKAYDYLLLQLGDLDKILLEAGKYSGETFKDEVSKKFITAFTDIPRTITQELTKTIQDWGGDGWYGDIITTTTTRIVDNAQFTEIYDAWVNYAKSIDKSVMEALSQSVASFIKSKRDFEVWSLGDSIEALAKKAQFAEEDFSNLENIIGTTGITVDNYLTMYNNAIKNNFTAETITQWDSLGDALISATDAQKAYTDAITQSNETIRQSALTALSTELTSWISALGSVQNSINSISGTLRSFKDLENTALTLDNYSTLLSQLEDTRQNEISALQTTYNTRITQLTSEKTLFNSLANYVDDLNLKLLGSNITSDYFFDELGKAKATLLAGGTVDASKLTSSAESYLDSALQNSTSQLDYFREVAKVKAGISDLGTKLTGGSLEGIEAAIASEEATLAFKLDLLNQTAIGILNGWKSTATNTISTTTDKYNALNEDVVAKAYSEVLGRTAEKEGYAYWTEQITKGNITALNIKEAIANAALSLNPATYAGNVSSIALEESMANAKKWLNGSHATGLKRVPYNGYIAELHKDEEVLTATEARQNEVIKKLSKEIEDLNENFRNNTAELVRMRAVIEKLDFNTNGELIVGGAVA